MKVKSILSNKCYFVIMILIVIISCSSKSKVDLIIYNAKIYTVDDNFSIANYMVIKHGRIINIGISKNIFNQNYQATKIIDARGKIILPGLIDAHCHFYGLGLSKQIANLKETKNFQEVLSRLVKFDNEEPLPYLRGRGWDQNDWEKKSFPTKKEIDKLFPDKPVILERIDGHAYLVNQKALDLAGITNKTIAKGGEIIKENGKLTGVLIDGPMSLLDSIISKPNEKSKELALLEAQKSCLSFGLTTVNDAGLDKETIDLIDKLHNEQKLKIRIYAMINSNSKELNYYLEKGVKKTDRLNVSSVKVYSDGALGSRGAVLKEPYSDSENHYGKLVTQWDELKNIALRIRDAGFQMNTHAIGDSSNSYVLKIYKNVLKDKSDARWKIEHVQVIDVKDISFFNSNIIPSVQPTHATSDMYWAKERLGDDRLKGAYAYKSLLNSNGIIALGTDFPVENVNPFLTLYAAVARKDLNGYPKNGFMPEQKLTRKQAIRGMTIWAAFSNFEENEKGSLEIGKFADFIIIDRDIMMIDEEEIPKTRVLQTYIYGENVYILED